ncbi:MAG: hypothetical protein Kow00121_36150 [Elainellaceae cyanobacterium]
MNRFILASLLTLFTISCNTQTPSPSASSSPDQTPDQTVVSPAPTTEATEQAQNQYSSPFGFEFTHPDDYVVAIADEPITETDRPLQGVIEIWKESDYSAIQSESFEGGEYPPNISIEVFANPDQLPLSEWKAELSHGDDRLIAVAGQEAIAYTATGLYETDQVVLNSPDGRSVIRLSVGYIDSADPMRQVFQEVVASLSFER